jgi:hypothetical protein
LGFLGTSWPEAGDRNNDASNKVMKAEAATITGFD